MWVNLTFLVNFININFLNINFIIINFTSLSHLNVLFNIPLKKAQNSAIFIGAIEDFSTAIVDIFSKKGEGASAFKVQKNTPVRRHFPHRVILWNHAHKWNIHRFHNAFKAQHFAVQQEVATHPINHQILVFNLILT